MTGRRLGAVKDDLRRLWEAARRPASLIPASGAVCRSTRRSCFRRPRGAPRPLVWAVCRSILRDPHDVEDAFQATFLILARKAHSLWVRDSLCRWLYRVSYRVAQQARIQRDRRRSESRLWSNASRPRRGKPLVRNCVRSKPRDQPVTGKVSPADRPVSAGRADPQASGRPTGLAARYRRHAADPGAGSAAPTKKTAIRR